MAFTGDSLKQMKSFLLVNNADDLTNSSALHGTDDNESTGTDSDEYTNSKYQGILDENLTSLTAEQRTAFVVVVAMLLIFSLCGNICTLYVNVHRKIRPFFRACLISLAIGDILSTIFLTCAFMSAFSAEYVQIWRLGAFMCSFVPFITTAAILASSMVIVGIALDRYFAVMKAAIGFWNPTVRFCVICICSIWVASLGISCPVLAIYELYPIYILTKVPVEGGGTEIVARNSTRTLGLSANVPAPIRSSSAWLHQEVSNKNVPDVFVQEHKQVAICVSNQRNVGLYYIIVFSIIFVPCIIAFIWLNSIIAKKLWRRRHSVETNRKSKKFKSKTTIKPTGQLNAIKSCNCSFGHHTKAIKPMSPLGSADRLAITTTGIKQTSKTPSINNNKSKNSRGARHLRMFTIVILLMTVFLLFRLPAWVFLVMRMYGSYSKKAHWILYFSFGVLNLTSCVLNPIFYTFLAQTIAYITRIKVLIWDNYCGLRLCYERRRRNSHVPVDEPTFLGKNISPPELEPDWSCGFCCTACGLPKSTFFYAGTMKKCVGDSSKEEDLPPVIVKQQPQLLRDDKDEGVDCSDVSDDEESGMDGFYNERVYTIFPEALVSSSVGSD